MQNTIGRLSVLVVALFALLRAATDTAQAQMVMKTETFDSDPGWDGRNNRATTPPPATVTQNFGYSFTSNAGGPAGEIGGFITPCGEPAYYAQSIPVATLDQPLSASGTLKVAAGGGNTLLGFFNSNTINEWRAANSLALRIYGRDDYFYAYGEYGTSKWRAGAKAVGPGGSEYLFNSSAVYNWALSYDPNANGGGGAISASIGSITTVFNLDPGHKLDGATFNRFGLLNVVKSYDGPGRLWVDNLSINGGATQTFSSNPGYDSLRNRTTYTSTNVRPRFDFGYSPNTNFAGGAGTGEMGGHTFRGDSRPDFQGLRMAYYGDRLQQTLDLTTPLKASGKVAFVRGVTDSTTLIGFFHSTGSVRDSTNDNPTPENFMGAAIEGPSAEGFFFYPAYGIDQEGQSPLVRGDNPPYIYPDSTSHNFEIEYDPQGNGGGGRLTVSLDGQEVFMDLLPGHKAIGASFDRFGIITTHRDGNGQTIYFDDLMYTVAIPEPTMIGALAAGVFAAAMLRQRRNQQTNQSNS
ncbi:hypothetical protein [Fontivita pretiosa]|uniref:hypothetical protein n=1 Tax=Fontivita pretiosa TaxID=2989684 RepID=UPI003D165877